MEIKGLTYEEIMELYNNGFPLLKEWLHDNAHLIMEKEKPLRLEGFENIHLRFEGLINLHFSC